MDPQYEKLPTGKIIIRQFADDGTIEREQQSYGLLDIGIDYHFNSGVKVEELYFAKRRMVGRRSYEKARLSYPDMPTADDSLEDVCGGLLTDLRKEQRRKKTEAEERLALSAESRFPRPAGTNWLRVISGEQGHLVEFASRDWKSLSRDRSISTGPDWLSLFGFDGPDDVKGRSVAEGPIIGYEVVGNRQAMLEASRKLLDEVRAYTPATRDPTWCNFSVRKKPKPRRPKPLTWTSVLPPLIQFLEGLNAQTVKVYNHHQ